MRPRLTPVMADARRAVREKFEELSLAPGDRILVAASGGADSTALAAACAFEGAKAGILVAGAIVDHGLQSGSHEIAQQAQQRLLAIGLDPVAIEQVTVAVRGEGIEAAAREVRYAALERARRLVDAKWIFLGHNLDDQAETVLLGLSRGSGLRSISGMPSVDESRRLVRPLLGMPRAELRQACIDQGLEFWDDPHNLDDRFLRVKVRNLANILEETLGPGFAASLARTAQSAALADDLISQLARASEQQARLAGGSTSVEYSIKELNSLHPAVRFQTLHLMLQQASGKSISSSQVAEVDALITNWHGQKPLSLPGITVERVASALVVKKNQKLTPGAC